MADSDVAIANAALLYLGDLRIASLDEDTDRARLVSGLYAIARDGLLVSAPWRFALVRQDLAALAAEPVYGYTTAFAYPTDPPCLMALDTSEDSTWPGEPEWPWSPDGKAWAVESLNGDTVILSDASALSLRYIARMEDPVKFSEPFTQALIAKLRAELCYPILQKADLVAPMQAEAARVIARAKAQNARELRGPVRPDRTLLTIRNR